MTPDQLTTLGLWDNSPLPPYCEPILERYFGASDCHSIDNSDYEGATFVADLNEPVSAPSLTGYEVVLDLGTLEHVFDVRTAFANVDRFASIGGTIAHSLPANQQCGHGFYQFSPEFFYSYYSQERGFSSTTVFVVREEFPDVWFRVPAPTEGHRALIQGGASLYAVCLTEKVNLASPQTGVQQSDYRWAWERGKQEQSAFSFAPGEGSQPSNGLRRKLARVPAARALRDASRSALGRGNEAWSTLRGSLRSSVPLERVYMGPRRSAAD